MHSYFFLHFFNSRTFFHHSLLPFQDCSAGSRKLGFLKTFLARDTLLFLHSMINPGYGFNNFFEISCFHGQELVLSLFYHLEIGKKMPKAMKAKKYDLKRKNNG